MPSWTCPICPKEGKQPVTFSSRTAAGLGLQRSNHLRSHGISTRGMPLSMKVDNRHFIALYLAQKSFNKSMEKMDSGVWNWQEITREELVRRHKEDGCHIECSDTPYHTWVYEIDEEERLTFAEEEVAFLKSLRQNKEAKK